MIADQPSLACSWWTYLRRSRGCTWCFRSLSGSFPARRSTAEAHRPLPRPARCSWWWLYPEQPARTGGERRSQLLCLWSLLSLEPSLERKPQFYKTLLFVTFQGKHNKKSSKVPTNSTGGSQAEENHIAALSVMQQLDELMQHDGDGRNTHAVLQYRKGSVWLEEKEYITLLLMLPVQHSHLSRAQVQLYTCSTDLFPHRCLWVLRDFRAGSAPGAWTGQKPSFGSSFHQHTQTKEVKKWTHNYISWFLWPRCFNVWNSAFCEP